jgi:hypothetical protein
MIRYALICDKKHQFDVWFGNSADYDKQRKRSLVTCPACGSTKVEKAVMAPAVSRTRKRAAARPVPVPAPIAHSAPASPAPEPVAIISPQEQELRARVKELRDQLIKNSDDVGSKFPEEARKMHYGEIEHRSIYGEASLEEAKEMHEEGIAFHPLPVLPDERN